MKKIISAVVAMNKERVIGVNNQLPWHIPEDLAYFKKVTFGKPIIMGRKTFESIGRVLPGRRNIVISRSNFSFAGLEVYSSLEQALQATCDDTEVAIIGGGELFNLAMPIINSLHLTLVDFPVANPTVLFPDVDLSNWKLIEQNEIISTSGINCRFNHYILS